MALAMPGCAQAAGTFYYVATDGDDSHDGKSLQTPFRRIQKAADVMQPGDTCLIRGGQYREKIVPVRGGSSEHARITYRNYADETPVIEGSERVRDWVDQGGGVWKAQLPPGFFDSSPYNPFITKASGHCIVNPGNAWSLGMVYLNGEPLSERTTLADVQSSPRTWCASQENGATAICARFDVDPNAAAAEVSVRDSCFDPGEQVLNFISIQGLTMKQASPNGSGPLYPQRGIITVHAGKGWAIEGCVISDSPCSGIALATGPESWYGPRSATQEANGTAPDFHASGFHLVRHNTIERCGQAGIIGMINGHSSIIEGNLIQDINWQQKLGGAETAGIKLHWAHDVLLRSNIIRRVYTTNLAGSNHFGVWLDFANQGARITGNIIYDIIDPFNVTPKKSPVYLEANVGPIVVDNNILIKHASDSYNNDLGSLHSVAVHNLLLEGRLVHFTDPSRRVPYYEPNSMQFVGSLQPLEAQDPNIVRHVNRNNIYIGAFSACNDEVRDAQGNVQFDRSEQQALGFRHADAPTGVAIGFDLSDGALARLAGCDLITSEGLGEFPLVKQQIADRDGQPYDIDTDIQGRPRTREPGSVMPGPFAGLVTGKNEFVFSAGASVWPGAEETRTEEKPKQATADRRGADGGHQTVAATAGHRSVADTPLVRRHS